MRGPWAIPNDPRMSEPWEPFVPDEIPRIGPDEDEDDDEQEDDEECQGE